MQPIILCIVHDPHLSDLLLCGLVRCGPLQGSDPLFESPDLRVGVGQRVPRDPDPAPKVSPPS